MDVLKQCEGTFFISVSFSCVARGSLCEGGLLSNDNQAEDSLWNSADFDLTGQLLLLFTTFWAALQLKVFLNEAGFASACCSPGLWAAAGAAGCPPVSPPPATGEPAPSPTSAAPSAAARSSLLSAAAPEPESPSSARHSRFLSSFHRSLTQPGNLTGIRKQTLNNTGASEIHYSQREWSVLMFIETSFIWSDIEVV